MSAKPRVHLSLAHMGGYEQQYIQNAFETNWIAPLGPNVDAFEQEVADYVGTKGALALNSGTAAIHMAIKLIGVQKGDRVFCSSLTFAASANPICYEGGEPVFIDSEPQSWNMSPQALERAFHEAAKEGKLPKAGIIVDLYGQSANMKPLLEIFDHYKVPVIEDAAEALGANYQGKACGSFGRFGVLSFNGNKIITTSGGGMLMSDDIEALHKARFWSTQARDQARHYQHSEIGYNYRMSNVLAGIGRGQLKVLDEHVNLRRAVFDRYEQALQHIEGLSFMPEAAYGRANRWLTTLTIDPAKHNRSIQQILDRFEEENIEARPVWKPLHLQPVFKDCKYYPHGTHAACHRDVSRDTPHGDSAEGSVSDYLFENGICLPSGSNMTMEDQERVIRVLSE